MHPAQEPEQLRLAAQCGARTRSGTPCRSPAVTGRSRCRMHGGAPGSGGPKGRRNGNYKHGRYRGDRLSQVGEAAHTRREGTDQETASVPVRGGSGGGDQRSDFICSFICLSPLGVAAVRQPFVLKWPAVKAHFGPLWWEQEYPRIGAVFAPVDVRRARPTQAARLQSFRAGLCGR
jgi:hypothetical protein